MSDVSNLPAPLVPAGCSMGANDHFPFYFDRLRGSRWWRRASDLCRARNVMLWGEAYKSTPAGSLPDDDDELAEAAGFGFDVDAFLAAKDEIMGPWVLCSDGRWYHPTVCEVVLETWEKTSEQRRLARTKKAEQRARLKAQTRPVPAKMARVPRDSANGPEGRPQMSPGTEAHSEARPPQPFFDKEKGEVEVSEAIASSVASAAPKSTEGALALRLDEPEPVVRGEPWDRDPEFGKLWEAATPQARKRAKSKAKVWPEWVRARRLGLPSAIVAGYVRYKALDPDVGRSGGPGLHIWLRDRTWEQWTGGETDRTAAWTDAEWRTALRLHRETGGWSDELGPTPGSPGCRVPPRLLVQAAQNLGATA